MIPIGRFGDEGNYQRSRESVPGRSGSLGFSLVVRGKLEMLCLPYVRGSVSQLSIAVTNNEIAMKSYLNVILYEIAILYKIN